MLTTGRFEWIDSAVPSFDDTSPMWCHQNTWNAIDTFSLLEPNFHIDQQGNRDGCVALTRWSVGDICLNDEFCIKHKYPFVCEKSSFTIPVPCRNITCPPFTECIDNANDYICAPLALTDSIDKKKRLSLGLGIGFGLLGLFLLSGLSLWWYWRRSRSIQRKSGVSGLSVDSIATKVEIKPQRSKMARAMLNLDDELQ
ncbi:unnamed protein product [Didymodactylos carnosus]|uniref:Uncharacterized protein n=1 Tax=Didymodactylos carnosus TaxID=1234261 RepID=A0A814A513_9BILA|nr:unnamed protein product [Didymodactylos carnosus]CAF3689584.1 unnamed protein product [Didymodactylos carnosus]